MWRRALVSIGIPAAALVVSKALFPDHSTPFILFYPTVAFAAWYGGFGAGALSSLVSLALVDYFLLRPRDGIAPGQDSVVLLVFLVSTLVISRLAGAHRSALLTAKSLSQQLRLRADDLQTQLTAVEQRGHLFSLAASLARANTPEEVAAVLFREGLAAVGADAGSLGVLSDDVGGSRTVTIEHSAGYTPETVQAFQRFPLTAGRPLSDAILTGVPVLLGSAEEWSKRYPESFKSVADSEFEAFAGVPVFSGGRVVAGVSFSFRGTRAFDANTTVFLQTLATVSGQALERARAYEAQRKAREQMSTVVESVTDGFVALDADFRYTYINQRAAEMWGRPVASVIGRTPLEVFSDVEGIERSEAIATFRRVMETRKTETLETFAPTVGRWLEVRAYPSQDGGVAAYFQDITSRRRAQNATAFLADATASLAESSNYEQTLHNLARSAVPRLGDWCAVDVLRDPSATTWPPALDRLAMVHEDPKKIELATALLARYPANWDQPSGTGTVLKTGRSAYVPDITDEMLVQSARDAEHLELLHALQFRSIMIVPLVARETVLGVITFCMTESGRLYHPDDLALAEELGRRAGAAVDTARLLRDAEHANAAKTEFLRTMSHELRQPINATIAFVQLWELGLRGPLSEEIRGDIVRIQRNQAHLLALIDDLLSFTRLEAGTLAVAKKPVSMSEAVAAVEAVMSPQMKSCRIDFTTSCPSDLAAMGDHARIVQIAVNLATNALRATAPGGRVALHCSTDERFVRLQVSDTGVGIPAEKLEEIFQPFTQLGRSLRAPKEGAGLGLSISRGLADAMGGTISATSEVGKGSVFVLQLPIAA